MDSAEIPRLGTSFDLLERFRLGEDAAADAIFERYFERLVALARAGLSARIAQRVDPEDVVLSVYRSFFCDARMGRFSLARSGDLWRLLAAITRHKVLHQARYHRAERRSVGAEIPLDANDVVRCDEPTVEEAVALGDVMEDVFSRLDPFARRVLELRLQDLTLEVIAERLKRSERTIRRTLDRIRDLLTRRLADE